MLETKTSLLPRFAYTNRPLPLPFRIESIGRECQRECRLKTVFTLLLDKLISHNFQFTLEELKNLTRKRGKMAGPQGSGRVP